MTGSEYSPLDALRELDPERYACCLYLPNTVRDDIATLWAFDAEVNRIPSLVSEPMPGEIRLQWWRDLVKSAEPSGHGPLGTSLLETIARRNLPRETFHTYLEARIFDLYQDPMPDNGSFEGYFGETVSVFFQLSALCLGAERDTNLANACGHAGMAVGISRLVARCGFSRARGQCFVPLDLLEKHDLDRKAWVEEHVKDAHFMVLDELVRTAQYHLTFARTVVSNLPKTLRPVFLELALVEPKLKLVKRKPEQALMAGVAISPLARQWHLFRGAMRPVA